MSSNPPSQAELTDAIESATRQAVTELFAQHCEQFYYLTLITVGEALSPVLSAWSVEALERAELRLGAMEEALARLDRMGIFGTGEARNRIVVNAEVMPPDYSNTVRAQRLNPPAAIRDWLIHVAEY